MLLLYLLIYFKTLKLISDCYKTQLTFLPNRKMFVGAFVSELKGLRAGLREGLLVLHSINANSKMHSRPRFFAQHIRAATGNIVAS